MPTLDPIIHQPVRLQIMAALNALGDKESLNFTYLKGVTGATDGNLGAHLLKLEESGYLSQERAFVNRKPRTYIRATEKGRASFKEHVEALKNLLEPRRQMNERREED
jgi:DNA-binding MarR family transcriptional regulator